MKESSSQFVVTADEMRAYKFPAKPLRLRFSKSDGRLVELDPPQPQDRIRGELSGLVIDARQCGATYLSSARHLKLTRLMVVYMSLCRDNPDAIVLVHLAENYEALMHHAPTVAKALNLPLGRRTNTPMCSIPSGSIDRARERLRDLGHETVLAEYESSKPDLNSPTAA
jgi:hypothetical protein